MAAKIEVEVIGEIGSLERKLAKAQADLTRFKAQAETNAAGIAAANTRAGSSFAVLGGKSDGLLKSLKSPGGAFAGGLVASAALSQLKTVIDAGSSLNEQISKSNIVFADSAAEIQAWSKTTAESFGISRAAALEAAGTFGTITRSMGLPAVAAADLSKNLVNLAGDLASFNDVGTDDALLALRSAIVGEYEPLRRLGSALSETRVQTQALAETGKRSARELTNQEKVTARYNLILKDTVLAQGDAARTAGSFANQQRQLAAKAADLQANLGTLLLPAVTELVTQFNDAADAALVFADAFGKIGDIDLGPLGEVRDVLGEIADIATRVGPIGFVRNTADIIKLIRGGGGTPGVTGATPDPSGGIAGLIPDATVDPVTGRVTRGTAPAPQSVFQTAKPPIETLPVGFQNATLKAQNENNEDAFLKSLLRNRGFFETQLQRAIDAGDTVAIAKIRQNIEGTQAAIKGVYADRNSEAEAARKIIQDARDKAKDKAQREADNLASALGSLGDGIASAISTAADAIKRIQDGLKQQADEFKAAALKLIDRKQTDLSTKRALADATADLALARKLGGPEGIKIAKRELEDATLNRDRFRLEGSKVTANVQGGYTVVLNGAVIKADNPDELWAKLQRKAKSAPPQSRGRTPGQGVGFN